ncbi:50S ribosomal protein L31 [Chrysiogenes arsenatis]|uniref:50S ribosomal protein L31 n=1 Tax=Chrysiogenes arsenatis TaxID=309797 RepID=UPI0003F7E5B0|nr:50S ribosomal protein L31 [Chrysiogenes arsenatis]
MKEGIHPVVAPISVECMCGNVIETISTKVEGFKVEVCSQCHPLYTGQAKNMDSAGRVERFRKKYAAAQ